MRKFEYFVSEGDGMSFLVEIVDNEGKIVMQGDDYHDKIDQRVETFLEIIEEVYEEVECEEFWIDVEDESDFVWEEARVNCEKR